MAVFCVSYDLNKKGKNYDGLYEELKKEGYAHIMDSTWLVSTSESLQKLYNRIRLQTDDDDSIFISKVNREEYIGWLSKTYWDWLEKELT